MSSQQPNGAPIRIPFTDTKYWSPKKSESLNAPQRYHRLFELGCNKKCKIFPLFSFLFLYFLSNQADSMNNNKKKSVHDSPGVLGRKLCALGFTGLEDRPVEFYFIFSNFFPSVYFFTIFLHFKAKIFLLK